MPVGVQHHSAAHIVNFFYGFFKLFFAAQHFVRSIIGVSVIHTLLPPGKKEYHINTVFLPFLKYAGKVAVTVEKLSVLVLHNNSLPAVKSFYAFASGYGL